MPFPGRYSGAAERPDGRRHLGAPGVALSPAARPERKAGAAVAPLATIGRAVAEEDGGTADLDAFLAPVFAADLRDQQGTYLLDAMSAADRF